MFIFPCFSFSHIYNFKNKNCFSSVFFVNFLSFYLSNSWFFSVFPFNSMSFLFFFFYFFICSFLKFFEVFSIFSFYVLFPKNVFFLCFLIFYSCFVSLRKTNPFFLVFMFFIHVFLSFIYSYSNSQSSWLVHTPYIILKYMVHHKIGIIRNRLFTC